MRHKGMKKPVKKVVKKPTTKRKLPVRGERTKKSMKRKGKK